VKEGLNWGENLALINNPLSQPLPGGERSFGSSDRNVCATKKAGSQP
jgi:hypothetical protein